MQDIRNAFEAVGGEFVISIEELAEKFSRIRAFVFDWDGVFNEGVKFGDQGSPFSETDSMGTNLLRLAHWLNHDQQMPLCGIITGAVNAGTDYFARREGFDFVIRGFTDKSHSWNILLKEFNVAPDEVMYVFDDVLDLPIARACGLRFLVRQSSSPAFRDYVIDNELCDYITAHRGGQGAVREVAELLLELQEMYTNVLEVRTAYSPELYGQYLAARKAGEPRIIKP